MTNLESLISAVITIGVAYNPSKDSIKLPALQSLLTAANESLIALKTAESANFTAIDVRELAFKPTGSLFTKVSNALKASNSSIQADETAKTILRKLQGKRASAKLTDEEKTALEAEGKEVNQISASQMGYDERVDNFEKLISFLQSIPDYNPNEEELKIETLQTLLTDLKVKNGEVMKIYFVLETARGVRNDLLYKPLSGVVDLAADVKSYIKSVFGATSTQYKLVSKLRFATH
ncbi:MAG: hypothetical protein Q7U47_15925 [Paludibacter sp.]|nr:hypothetical protein [Paludibacter sp.]